MRTQEQRDEQTLDIMSAVFGVALVCVALAFLAFLADAVGVVDVVGPVVLLPLAAAYVVVAVVRLRRR